MSSNDKSLRASTRSSSNSVSSFSHAKRSSRKKDRLVCSVSCCMQAFPTNGEYIKLNPCSCSICYKCLLYAHAERGPLTLICPTCDTPVDAHQIHKNRLPRGHAVKYNSKKKQPRYKIGNLVEVSAVWSAQQCRGTARLHRVIVSFLSERLFCTFSYGKFLVFGTTSSLMMDSHRHVILLSVSIQRRDHQWQNPKKISERHPDLPHMGHLPYQQPPQ